MAARFDRSEWPALIGGFTLGLLIAIGMVVIWLMLSRGTAESFDVTGGAARVSPAAGGLIGSTAARIEERLTEERRAVRPARGDLRFRVERIVWEDPAGPPFIRAAEMTGRLDTRALQDGNIYVRGVVIRDGDVLVERGATEEWNYKRAMASLLEDDDDAGPQRVFVVTDIAIRNVDVRVSMPERSFTIENLAAQLPRAEFAGPGLDAPRVTAARATGTLVAGDSTYPLVAENGVFVFPTGRVDFDVQRLATGETTLTGLSGSYGGDLPGLALRATGVVEQLRFQDVRFLSPRLPATGTAAFSFRVLPVSSQITRVQVTDARLESEGSRASGSATIHIGEDALSLEEIDARFDPLALSLVEQMLGDTLPYRGTITGTARGTGGLITFDVTTRLTTAEVREPFASRITGSARLAAGDIELRGLEADLRAVPLAALRAVAPGLPLRGTITGRIALTGPPERAPLNVNVRLELAGGVALVEGRIDLTGSIPAYDLSGRLIAINVQQLLQPAVPPVFLTARFSIAGSGADPARANARVSINGRFTGWRTTPNDTIHIAARVANGTVTVDTSSVRLATMSAGASGRWRFTTPSAGSIEYRAAFEPITPFGPFIPVIGDEDASGTLRVAGTLAGDTSRIQVAGNTTAANFSVGAWGVASLEGKYLFVIGPAVPEVAFEGSARDLTTPTAGNYQTASANLSLQSPLFALEVHADRAGGEGGIEIIADGRIPPTGIREVIVQRARLDLGADNWALARPAVFSWESPQANLDVRDFELRKDDGNGLVRLDGRVLPLANADFRLETVALPVGDMQALLGRPERVSGALSATAELRASDGIPQLSTRFQLDNAIIENVRFSQVAGDMSYADQELIANATAVDSAGALRLNAELPVELRFGENRRARLLETGVVQVTLVSDSIALAPFAAAHPDIRDVAGSLAANVTVTGTVEAPVLGGSLTVRNGAVHVIPLNQGFDSINAVIALENRRAVIQDFVARSGGRMRASGAVEFEDLTKPVLDLAAVLNDFEILGVDNQTDAGVTGDVRLAGPLSEAVLTGDVRIEDGFVPIPQTGTRSLDMELAQFEANLPATGARAEAQTSLYRSLTIDDLRITVGDDLWFIMEDARAQLSGELTVAKRGDALSVVGELEGERGRYTLRAGPIIRRFDVLSANIRFLGGRDINPALEILARRRVIDLTGDQFDIEVRIGGTMERPTLALASAEAGTIPQSELLSFLLFGQPSVALGGTTLTAPRELIGETYIGGIAELLSMEIEQAVIDEMGMGLDIFQIRLGGGRLANIDRASLVVGEEIGSDLFLTVESGVETLFGGAGGTAAATFALRIEWRITDHTTVRASYEPVNDASALRGSSVTPTLLERKYQRTLELRRRWTW